MRQAPLTTRRPAGRIARQLSVLFSIDVFELIDQDVIVPFDELVTAEDRNWLASLLPAADLHQATARRRRHPGLLGAGPGNRAERHRLPHPGPPHGTVKVQAVLAAVGGSADGVSVFFYDGDPGAGGRAFDHEMVPHIRPDDTYLAQVLFEPRTCGDHTLVVVANPGRMDAGVGSATLRVALDPVEAMADLAGFVAGFGLPRGIGNSLLAKVRAAEASFARGNRTPALNQLGALQHQLNAQRGKQIPVAAADAILENLQRVRGCLRV